MIPRYHHQPEVQGETVRGPHAVDQTEMVIGEGVAAVMEDDALNRRFGQCRAVGTDVMPQYQWMGLHKVEQSFCAIMNRAPTTHTSTNS